MEDSAMRSLGCAALFIALGAVGACMSFEPLEPGRCGNGVIDKEAGEDCDGFVPGEGTTCAGPMEPHACRFTCDRMKAESCPTGYTCGTDAICRAPSGRFMSASATFEEDAEDLLVGDFDGDRARDLMVVGAVEKRIHYFDETGAPASTQKIVGVKTRPAVGKLTVPPSGMAGAAADMTDDFAFLAGGGIGVMRGHPGRTFAPAQYPAAVVPPTVAFSVFLMDAITQEGFHSHPGDEILGMFQLQSMPGSYSIGTPSELNNASFTDSLPGPLLGDIATADLYGGPADGMFEPACEEAVFAFSNKAGPDSITIFSPCYKKAGNDAKGKMQIALGDTKLLGPPRLADINSDGKIDIVAGGYVPGDNLQKCHVIAVALNTGNGTFFLQNNQAVLVNDYRLPDGSCYFDEKEPLAILAAGDINGDGKGDYIDGLGAHLGTGLGFLHIAAPNGRWSSALIDDFNADGIVDIAAGSLVTPGIDFMQGTGNQDTPVNPVLIPTQLPTTGFVSGYFDNDGVRDIAVIERSAYDPKAPVNTTGDALSVLYGRALTSPEPPVEMGRLDTIHSLTSGGSVQTSTIPDGMSDLLVTAGRTPPNKVGATDFGTDLQKVLFFSGSPDRALQSPFRLSTEGQNPMPPQMAEERPNLPLQVALGQFDSDAEGRTDAAVLSVQGRIDENDKLVIEYFMWLLPGGPEAEFAPVMKDELYSSLDVDLSTPSDPLNVPNIDELKLFDTRIGAINLDGTGPDELVGFSPTDLGVRISVFSVKELSVKYGPKMDMTRTLKQWGLQQPVLEPVRFHAAKQVTFADINGDGLQEILGLFTTAPAMGDAPAVERLMVFQNNGAGLDKLNADAFTEIASPPAPPGAPANGPSMPVRAFALVNADLDPEIEIAVVTDASTFIYKVSTGDYLRDEKKDVIVAAPVGGDLAAGGDFNNDGLDDLVISSSTANVVRVFRGAPTNPR
jgi:hypothetical protein